MRFFLHFMKRLLAILGYGLGGAFIAGVIAYGYVLLDRPDLAPWHKTTLDEEFHAGRARDLITRYENDAGLPHMGNLKPIEPTLLLVTFHRSSPA